MWRHVSRPKKQEYIRALLPVVYGPFLSLFYWPQAWTHVWKQFQTSATYTKVIQRLLSPEVVFDFSSGYLRHFCLRD